MKSCSAHVYRRDQIQLYLPKRNLNPIPKLYSKLEFKFELKESTCPFVSEIGADVMILIPE